MHAEILRSRLAAPGAVKPRQRLRAAFVERLAENIARPGAPAGIGTGSIGHDSYPLCRALLAAAGEAPLDCVPNIDRQIDPVQAGDLLDTRWRGHVNLGHVIADHVDADEDKALLPERRPD